MIIEYGIAVLSALVIDGIWLTVISKSIYQKYIGDLMLKQAHLFPALLFYLIFGLAIVVFITSPALKNGWNFGTILAHGALLGLVIYGGYDLTNLAILKGWPIAISVIDISWGVTLSSLVSLTTVYLSKLFIR
jgi:uncharacterized membrane protein